MDQPEKPEDRRSIKKIKQPGLAAQKFDGEESALSSAVSLGCLQIQFDYNERNRLQSVNKCDNIFLVNTNVFLVRTQAEMEWKKNKVLSVKAKAVPEVLLKVAEAKKLIASEKAMTIQEATDQLGISRSSFYKYKDDIFPFYDNAKGKTITMVLQMDDEQGLLSDLLHIVAIYKANILTIHQSIPVNNVATLTLSVEVRSDTGNISHMVEEMEENSGVHNVKIIARE